MENDSTFIEFKREREMGEVLSDTFKFVRLNFKMLLKIMLRLVGPVLAVLILALIAYNYFAIGSSKSLFDLTEANGQINTQAMGIFGSKILVGGLFLALFSVLFYAVFYASMNFAIKSYIENNGRIVYEEVALNVRRTWGRFIGATILTFLMVMMGLMFCLVPGIYLSVPLILVFPIMAFYDMGVGESIAHCFKLVKNNWWMSFLTLFIMTIIFYLASVVFQLPGAIYSLAKTISTSKDITTIGMGVYNFDWIYILLSVIGSLATYILFGLLIISVTFVFFNLNEKKYQSGALDAIDKLGEAH